MKFRNTTVGFAISVIGLVCYLVIQGQFDSGGAGGGLEGVTPTSEAPAGGDVVELSIQEMGRAGRSAAGASEGVRILLSDMDTGSAVRGAQVTALCSRGMASSETDEWGVAVIGLSEPGIPVMIWAKETGYCDLLAVVDGCGTHSFGMRAAAVVTVRIVDENGTPQEGHQVHLLPARAGGASWGHEWMTLPREFDRVTDTAMRPFRVSLGTTADSELSEFDNALGTASGSIEPGVLTHPLGELFDLGESGSGMPFVRMTATTDANGVAVFSGLPAMTGLRWGVPGVNLYSIGPQREIESRVGADGAILDRGVDADLHVSGRFDLEGGSAVELAGVLVRGGLVSGFLAGFGEWDDVHVKLFGQANAATSQAMGYEMLSLEGHCYLRDSPDFEFRGVQPGRKVVRAHWRTESNEYCYASKWFDVGVGEHVNLGGVEPSDSTELRLRIPLVAMPESVVLDATDLGAMAADGELPTLVLSVMGWGEAAGAFPTVDMKLNVKPCADVRVLGVPPGRVRLALQWHPQADLLRLREWSVLLPDPVEVVHVAGASYSLPLRIQRNCAVKIAAQWQGGPGVADLEAVVLSAVGGHEQRVRLRPDGDRSVVGEVGVPAGSYLLCVVPAQMQSGGAALDRAYQGQLEIVGDSTVKVSLDRTSSVRAVPANPDSRRLVGPLAKVSPDGWGLGMPVYKAYVDPEGCFVIYGLMPGVQYSANVGSFIAPAAGDCLEVHY